MAEVPPRRSTPLGVDAQRKETCIHAEERIPVTEREAAIEDIAADKFSAMLIIAEEQERHLN